MRIPKSWIPPMAGKVVDALLEERLIVTDLDRAALTRAVEALMAGELMVEDRLNDEVRAMLTKFESDISRGKADYRTLFDLTKQKLVRERNIVL